MPDRELGRLRSTGPRLNVVGDDATVVVRRSLARRSLRESATAPLIREWATLSGVEGRRATAQRELEQRVENIEETFETQFLQFRAEVRADFSATRAEIREVRAHTDALHKETKEQIEMLATHFNDVHREVREGFARLKRSE